MSMTTKGEVRFSAGEDNYILVFSINALVSLERELGIGVAEVGSQLGQALRISTLRTIFWAGLLQHHNLNEEQAGDVIQQIGAVKAGQLIAEAFAAAFPEAAKGGAARPRTAGAGTGTRS